MKRVLLCAFFGIQSLLWSNPIDSTPFAKFSELVFDDNDHWTIEVFFSDYFEEDTADSVILKIANVEAKLQTQFPGANLINVITSDSLSNPLSINREGDSIEIYTYSSFDRVRVDKLIFGDYPGASVGQPVVGNSIMRNSWEERLNIITIDCLTKISSLGAVNDTTGLGGIMKGSIYDKDNNLITILNPYSTGDVRYFQLETPLDIHTDGSFTTRIFFTIYTPGFLFLKVNDFDEFQDTLAIEPFELKDIHPDTVVVQDIHLISDCTYCGTDDAVEWDGLPNHHALAVINYPNPFNAETNFFIKLPDRMKAKEGNISIYNGIGRLVQEIPFKDGSSTRWDGKDMNGNTMPSGIFYYRLNIAGETLKTGSVVLLK